MSISPLARQTGIDVLLHRCRYLLPPAVVELAQRIAGSLEYLYIENESSTNGGNDRRRQIIQTLGVGRILIGTDGCGGELVDQVPRWMIICLLYTSPSPRD